MTGGALHRIADHQGGPASSPSGRRARSCTSQCTSAGCCSACRSAHRILGFPVKHVYGYLVHDAGRFARRPRRPPPRALAGVQAALGRRGRSRHSRYSSSRRAGPDRRAARRPALIQYLLSYVLHRRHVYGVERADSGYNIRAASRRAARVRAGARKARGRRRPARRRVHDVGWSRLDLFVDVREVGPDDRQAQQLDPADEQDQHDQRREAAGRRVGLDDPQQRPAR